MNKGLRHFISAALLMGTGFIVMSGNPRPDTEARDHPFAPITIEEVDSIMQGMSIEEKVGQLIVAKGMKHASKHVGGYIIDSSETLNQQPASASNIPMLVGVDLHETPSELNAFIVKESALASFRDPSSTAAYSTTLAKHLMDQGVNFTIGPCLNIPSDSTLMTSEDHAFSDSTELIIQHAEAFVGSMRAQGVLSVMGNFPLSYSEETNRPKRSRTEADFLKINRQSISPFKALINQGAQSVIVAQHSLSQHVDQGSIIHALRKDVGFNGLIWNDLSRDGMIPVDEVVAAINSGVDLVIINQSTEKMIGDLIASVEDDDLTEDVLNDRCRKVIESKLWLLDGEDVKKDKLSPRELELAARKALEENITLIRNKDSLLPLRRLDTTHLAVIQIGQTDSTLAGLIDRYAPAKSFVFDYETLEKDLTTFQEEAPQTNVVLLFVPPEKDLPKKQRGFSEHTKSVIERIAYAHRTVLFWSDHLSVLKDLGAIEPLESILLSNLETPWTTDYLIQAAFGGRPISGRLSRRIDGAYGRGDGIATPKIRLAYGIPEEVGIDVDDLIRIDEIAKSGIEAKAYPGAQVWFAKDGVVVVNRTYGHHTYKRERAVQHSDMYDIASITKIAASAAGLMRLTDDSLFSLDRSLCDYLGNWVDTTAYMQMNLREIFAHQAGLTPFIPFYTKTLSKGVPRYDFYSVVQSETYPLPVARELYARANQPDLMFRQIVNHKINEPKYKYSDVGYYFALRIIERQTHRRMDAYLDSIFYRPLGMTTMGYNPLRRFDKTRIPPTEYDKYFRHQLVHGYVHDPGAAMLGGVGGHAGLFSNANDLGKLMQMYLNGGMYGGDRYLNSETIADFTRCQFCDDDNRRGAVFDKPFRDGTEGPSCGCTDLEAFGHQGFTGTVTWADPRDQVVYVFLSNRVYPNAENRKLAQMDIRTEIQKAFHEAIAKGQPIADTGTQP